MGEQVSFVRAARRESLGRNRDFGILWSARAISDLGSNMSAVALPLLTLLTTHSAGETGLVAGAVQLGVLVPVLLSGALVDRFNGI